MQAPNFQQMTGYVSVSESDGSLKNCVATIYEKEIMPLEITCVGQTGRPIYEQRQCR